MTPPRVVRFGDRVFVEGLGTVRKAYALEQLARRARDAALARARAEYDAEWGAFWKCPCGASVDDPYPDRLNASACYYCGRRDWIRAGHSR